MPVSSVSFIYAVDGKLKAYLLDNESADGMTEEYKGSGLFLDANFKIYEALVRTYSRTTLGSRSDSTRSSKVVALASMELNIIDHWKRRPALPIGLTTTKGQAHALQWLPVGASTRKVPPSCLYK
ncbi:hypothetical protein LTR47_011695 [Exophiala xenobiotica]|nr:hypothetical protein LTR47_011695 [Exophiala xenobiotica]KAK5242978.1 hypothetical protein LTS06_011149 [Exophiala xenobiotica]KAK5310767.1 hypothetical protein LTR93_011945 [Exophiala xenobiotica]KAK5356101.1 hypothetical protein LTR11_011686 [Exophiala xenobiotica]KAK5431462.1 hypothetical protein LTR18_011338 [Exophiala xenobiotica]